MILFKDNQTCIKWLKNAAEYHVKRKHIDTCYRFALEMHKNKLVSIVYVSSAGRLADIFTKSL